MKNKPLIEPAVVSFDRDELTIQDAFTQNYFMGKSAPSSKTPAAK